MAPRLREGQGGGRGQQVGRRRQGTRDCCVPGARAAGGQLCLLRIVVTEHLSEGASDKSELRGKTHSKKQMRKKMPAESRLFSLIKIQSAFPECVA